MFIVSLNNKKSALYDVDDIFEERGKKEWLGKKCTPIYDNKGYLFYDIIADRFIEKNENAFGDDMECSGDRYSAFEEEMNKAIAEKYEQFNKGLQGLFNKKKVVVVKTTVRGFDDIGYNNHNEDVIYSIGKSLDDIMNLCNHEITQVMDIEGLLRIHCVDGDNIITYDLKKINKAGINYYNEILRRTGLNGDAEFECVLASDIWGNKKYSSLINYAKKYM